MEDVKSQLENTNNALSKHGEELEVELNKAHTFRDMLKERLAAAEAQVATLQDSLKQKSEECLKAQTDLNLKEQELASAEELQKNTDLDLERLRKLLSEAEAAASVNADGVSDRDADIEALKKALRAEREAREQDANSMRALKEEIHQKAQDLRRARGW